MTILTILHTPNPLLKQYSKKVTIFDDDLRIFLDDLEETRQAGIAAVGIAAPQVGKFIRAIIVDCSTTRKPVKNHGFLCLLNPEIKDWSGHEIGREGCLSVPDYTGNVIRATQITLHAQDPSGKELEFEMEGYEARVVQHEIDHLDGQLFLDRVISQRADLFQRKVYKK